MPLQDAIAESLPEFWATGTELVRAAGIWGLGGAVLGLVGVLLAAPLAALWTRGGWAAGCLWALLLSVSLGAAGLYAGVTYGVAKQCHRLVEQDMILERSAVTTLMIVAEERGHSDGDLASMLPTISDARERLRDDLAAGHLPGASTLGLGFPPLMDSVLENVEELDQLKLEELHELRIGAGGSGPESDALAKPTDSTRALLTSTAPIRRAAVNAIWGGAQPHFMAAAVMVALPLGLILIVGTITRLVRRGRRTSRPGPGPDGNA